jgi:dolichol-phosphate mannosyltransferase
MLQAVARTPEFGFSQVRLGIACPMANEEATATAFVDAVLAQCLDRGFKSVIFFAVLDRACTDATLDILHRRSAQLPALRVVWAPENKNVVDAYVRGYREALAAECDWILEIDAGFSHRSEDIPQFFETMALGYDCVFGSRFCHGGRMEDSPLERRLISRGGTWLANLLLGTRLKDMTSGFELFSRAAMQSLLDRGIESRGPFFQTEIKFNCRHLKTIEVPIVYRSPSHRVGAASLKDAFGNLWRLFRQRLGMPHGG